MKLVATYAVCMAGLHLDSFREERGACWKREGRRARLKKRVFGSSFEIGKDVVSQQR